MVRKSIHLLSRLTGMFPSETRDHLLARILCGEVFVDGERVRDPRKIVASDSDIRFLEKAFVSRGGWKLLRAIEEWNVMVDGKVFIDAGASTGGFTDVLLRRGASCVHTVDVGYNQLDFRIRKDPRVVVHERLNIMDAEEFDPAPDAAVADLSFRSVVKAAKHIIGLTREMWMIALVKPQFELHGREEGFSGIVREKALLGRILLEVIDRLDDECLAVRKAVPSPVKGRKGNTEFLFLVSGGSTDFYESNHEMKRNILGFVDGTDLE